MTRVAVLMGGISAEREVSLATGSQVSRALREEGFDVVEIDTSDRTFITTLQGLAPDAVFICLHGRLGEDGTVQGALELLGIPYVGSGVLASALAMDKAVSKMVFEAAGVPTPPYVILRRGDALDTAAVEVALGPKTVVKPASEGSAIGVTIAHSAEEVPAAVEDAWRHDDVVLIERFVPGVEVTVGVLGNEDAFALPTLEVVPEHEFYDYESKYGPGMSTHIIPARVSPRACEECRRLALLAHKVLGCRGMSRTDTIVAEERVFVLEVNTIPGMTQTSLFPEAASAAGIGFPELCRRLVELALEGRC